MRSFGGKGIEMSPNETLWTGAFYAVFIIGVIAGLFWATREIPHSRIRRAKIKS